MDPLVPIPRRSILVFAGVLVGILIYTIIKEVFFPPPPYDFSAFDKKFRARADSLKQILQRTEQITPAPSDQKFVEKESKAPQKAIPINTASVQQLIELPGIGPTIAKRIVAYRKQHGPFHSAEDLLKVKGIGRKKLEKIRHRIVIR